jgi:glycogen debranching enzyme
LVPLDDGTWEYQLYSVNRKIRLAAQGPAEFRSQWHISESRNIAVTLDGAAGNAGVDLALQSYRVVPEQPFSVYAAEKAAAGEHFSLWSEGLSRGRNDAYAETAKYVLWSNFVHRDGALSRDALYMNKLSMTNIWSWDNCFSAIALAKAHPRCALEQLLVIFDHQHESGVLPDYVNDLFASYSCVKPPIYGWTVQKLREQNDFFRGREWTLLLYERISRLTFFWLERRMYRDWGLCYYLHGNDSGWDNASVFHLGTPLCSPDLASYLVYQMDTLAELAVELDRPGEAEAWKAKSEKMFAAMLEHLRVPDGFISLNPLTGQSNPGAHSLINLLPLLVSRKHMEQAMTDSLVKQLEGFEENYGLATERTDSAYYREGGYWLGPVWAPVTLLFIDALYDAGYGEAARRLSAKFRKLPRISLMAENFDPRTGKGYDDNAFAWTAAVYLLLEDCEQREPYGDQGSGET